MSKKKKGKCFQFSKLKEKLGGKTADTGAETTRIQSDESGTERVVYEPDNRQTTKKIRRPSEGHQDLEEYFWNSRFSLGKFIWAQDDYDRDGGRGYSSRDDIYSISGGSYRSRNEKKEDDGILEGQSLKQYCCKKRSVLGWICCILKCICKTIWCLIKFLYKVWDSCGCCQCCCFIWTCVALAGLAYYFGREWGLICWTIGDKLYDWLVPEPFKLFHGIVKDVVNGLKSIPKIFDFK